MGSHVNGLSKKFFLLPCILTLLITVINTASAAFYSRNYSKIIHIVTVIVTVLWAVLREFKKTIITKHQLLMNDMHVLITFMSN